MFRKRKHWIWLDMCGTRNALLTHVLFNSSRSAQVFFRKTSKSSGLLHFSEVAKGLFQ